MKIDGQVLAGLAAGKKIGGKNPMAKFKNDMSIQSAQETFKKKGSEGNNVTKISKDSKSLARGN